MSLFDRFKKNNTAINTDIGQSVFPSQQGFVQQPTFAQQPTFLDPKNTFSLSKEESLQALSLRKDTLEFTLNKNNMNGLCSRVVVVMDISGSMRREFNNGYVQNLLDRVLPLALKFDDNGELDVWVFSRGFKRMPPMNINNYYGYVEREILSKRDPVFWGTTNYAPVMKDIYQRFVKEEPSNIPTYVLYVTDGANDDRRETTNTITELAKHNIFWEFVGIGNERFEYLEKLDELKGRVIDNANFIAINDLREVSDQDLYDMLLQEYPQWLQEAKQKGIL